MADKRPALGRGLSALIPERPRPRRPSASLDVDIDLLRPNKFQPRTAMDDGRLDELAASIRSNGIIQPIVVRRDGSRYEIVAGERRWRAVATRRPAEGPGRRPRYSRRTPARRRADREHPARGPQPDRGSARLPAAGRRSASHPGTDRRIGRQGSIVDRQLPAAAEAAERGTRERRQRHAVDGPRRALWPGSATRHNCCVSPATSSQSNSRCARPKR